MRTETLRIAAAQLKFRRTVPENVEVISRFISLAAQGGSDVILFPECALTGYNLDFRKIARSEVEVETGWGASLTVELFCTTVAACSRVVE